MHAVKTFAAAAAAALLAGCVATTTPRIAPLPDKVSDMTCLRLDQQADIEAKDSAKLPFFYLQVTHPGDWRPIVRNNAGRSVWIKNGSLRRIRSDRDYFLMEAISIEMPGKAVEHYRVETSEQACKAPSHRGSLTVTNYAGDDPKPFKQKFAFNLLGQETADRVARILCGYEAFPEADKEEQMARKWKECQANN